MSDRGSEPSNTLRPVVRALMGSPDFTANGSEVNDADADIVVANPHPVTAIFPGDWRLTIHSLKQSDRDKFAQTFQTIFKKSEAWCNGLGTLETVTTSYASRALSVLDESEDEEAMQIFGMEGVSTHMTSNISPLVEPCARGEFDLHGHYISDAIYGSVQYVRRPRDSDDQQVS